MLIAQLQLIPPAVQITREGRLSEMLRRVRSERLCIQIQTRLDAMSSMPGVRLLRSLAEDAAPRLFGAVVNLEELRGGERTVKYDGFTFSTTEQEGVLTAHLRCLITCLEEGVVNISPADPGKENVHIEITFTWKKKIPLEGAIDTHIVDL